MTGLLRIGAILSLAFILAGCKLAVILVEGGEVQSVSSGICQVTAPGVTGTACIHEVTDTNYSEIFTAVADPGWEFVRWNDGGDFLCQGDPTNSVCVVSNVGSAGNVFIEAVIASGKAFYILPIFEEIQAQELIGDNTVIVLGNEWAQVDLFTNLSWNDINAVCFGGACNGVLNGYDVTGWTWATVDDINALFTYYLSTYNNGGETSLGPGPDSVAEPDTLWGPAFFADGWRPTNIDFWGNRSINGSSMTLYGIGEAARNGSFGDSVAPQPTGLDGAATAGVAFVIDSFPVLGTWLYRTP